MCPASHGYRLYPVLYGYHCAPYGYISMPYTPWLPPCTSWLSLYPDLPVSCTSWLPLCILHPMVTPCNFSLLVLCTLWLISSVLNLIATSYTLDFMATSLHPAATTLHPMVTSLCPTPNGCLPVPCILCQVVVDSLYPLDTSFVHSCMDTHDGAPLHYLATCNSGYVIPTHYVHLPASHGSNPETYLHLATLIKSLNSAPHGCQPASHSCHLAICLHPAPLVTSLTRARTPMLGEPLPLSFIALCASIKKPLQW